MPDFDFLTDCAAASPEIPTVITRIRASTWHGQCSLHEARPFIMFLFESITGELYADFRETHLLYLDYAACPDGQEFAVSSACKTQAVNGFSEMQATPITDKLR